MQSKIVFGFIGGTSAKEYVSIYFSYKIKNISRNCAYGKKKSHMMAMCVEVELSLVRKGYRRLADLSALFYINSEEVIKC